MTPVGIEPTTFRFVAQNLNPCATAVPYILYNHCATTVPYILYNHCATAVHYILYNHCATAVHYILYNHCATAVPYILYNHCATAVPYVYYNHCATPVIETYRTFYEIILRNSAFRWLPLQEYITMRGSLNVKNGSSVSNVYLLYYVRIVVIVLCVLL